MWKPIAVVSLASGALVSCAALVLGPPRELEGQGGAGGTAGAGGTNGADGTGGIGGTGGADGTGGGTVSCSGGRVIWVRHFPAPVKQEPLALEPDGQGGVFISGIFEGALLDFGGGALEWEGELDMFLARLDADGNHLWSHRFGDSKSQKTLFLTLARTTDDGVLFAGSFAGSVDFGDGNPVIASGLGNAFVARYGADGAFLWKFKSSGTSTEVINSVGVDPGTGDIAAVGSFRGQMSLGGQMHTAGELDLFAVRLDSTGSRLWSKSFGGPSNDSGNSGAVDPQGRVVLGGAIATPGVDFGLGTLPVNGIHNDAYVAVLAADGEPVWAKHWGDGFTQDLHDVVIDPVTGDLVVTGRTDGTIDFGGEPLVGTTLNPYGLFVAKLDGDGDHVESAAFRDIETTLALTVDAQGNVLIASKFKNVVKLGGVEIDSQGKEDGVVLKLDASTLSHVWSLTFGSTGDDNAQAVAVDAQSNVFVAGTFQDRMTLEGCPALTSAGGSDIFLMKLAP